MTDCPNKCPMCCNNQFDFSKLPVVDRWNYDEIMITGGEPLLFTDTLVGVLISIDVSLRLNLFPDMKALLPKDIDLSLWKVKDMEWVENCPVPEGEDFRRIANLW